MKSLKGVLALGALIGAAGSAARADTGRFGDRALLESAVRQPADVAIGFRGHWVIQCVDKDGNIRWTEDRINKIPTAGLNHILSIVLAAGTQVTSWFVGLKDTGSVVAGDTLASHSGWTEDSTYTGNRKAFTPGSVAGGSVDNSASKASFAITGTTTLFGAFIASASSGTTGTLLAGVDFAASRSVLNGDTVTVQYTITATSSN